MEINNNINQGTIQVKASEILKKFKHKEDRYNFCRQKGFWLPNESGFDSTFFVKFLGKEKELLPIGKHSDFKLNYFRGDGALTKNFLIKIVKSKVDYEKYLPDNIKYENLSKDFLFSLIAHVDPLTYSAMYDLYKKKVSSNIYKKWNEYSINVKEDMMQSINEYVPAKNNIKNLKPFRLSKNHNETRVFIRNEEIANNNEINQEIEMPNAQQNIQLNMNHIRITPVAIEQRMENRQENLGNSGLANNFDEE